MDNQENEIYGYCGCPSYGGCCNNIKKDNKCNKKQPYVCKNIIIVSGPTGPRGAQGTTR